MGREPRGYIVWAGVLQVGSGLYLVTVRANAVNYTGADASFTETAKVTSPQDAKTKVYEMARDLCARLTAQGHTVLDVDVTTQPDL